MKQKYVFLITFLLLIIIPAATYFLLFNKNEKAPTASALNNALNSFAQCLADKKITMYGADWCPHCQREKRAFGDAFKLVPYVECPENPNLCLEKGIQGYPTWILPDGRKLAGEQGLEKLSKESGCLLTLP